MAFHQAIDAAEETNDQESKAKQIVVQGSVSSDG
jgi:hypothetical protein